MILILVLVFVKCCPLVLSERDFRALRFGKSDGDFIQMSSDIMDSATSQFSVCAWIRMRLESSFPIMLHYWSGSEEIVLGSNGYYNWVVGTNLNLEDKYNVPNGEWYHLCWTWTTWTYILTVYLNGDVVGSASTTERELKTGGRMSLGNSVRDSKHSGYSFGGDMFKLNIYSRVLTLSEIKRMSSDICSDEEDSLTPIRILSWEEILLSKSTGSVTKVLSGCNETVTSIILMKLYNNEQELAATKTSLDTLTKTLRTTQEDLATTKQKLSVIKTSLDSITHSFAQGEASTTTQEQGESSPVAIATTMQELTNSLRTAQDEIANTMQDLAATKTNLEQRLENLITDYKDSKSKLIF